MLPLQDFSDEAKKEFLNRGVKEDEIMVCTMTDLDKKGDFGESWLVLTREKLYCLSASATDFILKKKNLSPNDENNIASKFSKASFDTYEVDKIESSYIENFMSSNRFFIKMKNSEADSQNSVTIAVIFLTNTTKQRMFAFLEIFNRMKDSRDVLEDDPLFDQFNIKCPKCGHKYENPNRKFCTKCVKKSALFVRMFEYFLPHKLKLSFVSACLVYATVMSLVMPLINSKWFVKDILSVGGESDSPFRGKILFFTVVYFGINMFNLFVGIMQSRAINKMSIQVGQTMTMDIFSAMQKLSLGYFNNNATGRLMNRINSDPEVVKGFYTDIVPSLIINVVTFIGVTIIAFTLNWKLTLIVFIPVPIIVLIFKNRLPKLWRMYSKRWRSSSSLNSMLGDSLNGIRVVKAFAKEVDEANRFRKYSDRFNQANLKANLTYLTIFPVVSLLMGVTSQLITGVGGVMVIGKLMPYYELSLYMSYIGMIFAPLQFFTTFTDRMTEMTNSSQRIFEVLDTPREIMNVKNPIKLDNVKGNISFENVSFHYVANRPILKNMSFDIKQGDYIGLVGHTGAGKSTIANLITRLYDVISGAIKLDGHNIKNIDITTMRRNIAIVSQEIFIFRGTIADNIRYAQPNATMEEVIAAAKAANAHDFIVNLPEGYETFVGTGSRSMSGGEQQRISIARALLLDPKILILDEATAAMDTETERLIQNAINELVKGRTTIVIAHRLSTLRECNYLFAIENGEVAESGTHIELIDKKGIYYKLYKLQSDAMKRVIAGE